MSRATDREATLFNLLDAAVVLLAERGYSQFRTADVAVRAGVSAGLVFHHLPTRRDIVVAAVRHAFGKSLQRWVADFEAVAPENLTRDRLIDLLWALISDPGITWTYEVYAAAAFDPQLRSALSEVLQQHSAAIDELATDVAVRLGGVPEGDAVAAVSMLIWSMQGLALNDMARDDAQRSDVLLGYLKRLGDAIYGPQ